jgi:hypothetical protein
MELSSTIVFGLKSFYILNITSTKKKTPLPSCVHALWNESTLQAEAPLLQGEIHYPKQNGNN